MFLKSSISFHLSSHVPGFSFTVIPCRFSSYFTYKMHLAQLSLPSGNLLFTCLLGHQSSFSSYHTSGFSVSLASFPQPFNHGTLQGSALASDFFTTYTPELGDVLTFFISSFPYFLCIYLFAPPPSTKTSALFLLYLLRITSTRNRV